MAWYDNLLGIKREGTLEKLNPSQAYYDHKTEPSREQTYSYEQAYEDLEIVNRGVNIVVDDASEIPASIGAPIPGVPGVIKGLKRSRVDILLNKEPNPFQDISTFKRNLITDFISKNNIDIKKINAISSHGHTIFHQPKQKLTFQLGCGAVIANKTQLTVVNDFRSLDVAFGGQGAPLVPVGDELLFNDYDYCLNLGGIANISFKKNNRRIAGDIGFANMFSNELSNKVGKDFDSMGNMAKSGNLNEDLLNQLNKCKVW